MKIQTAPVQFSSEHAPFFNYGILEFFGQNNSYNHCFVDAFSLFVVTVLINSNMVKTAIKTLLHHLVKKIVPQRSVIAAIFNHIS